MMEFCLKAIGVIHTPFTELAETPIQSSRSTALGEVEVFAEYEPGLEGIDEMSHLILLYVFHAAPSTVALKVKPFLDDEQHGVFATRHPSRPNPLGLSVVRLTQRSGRRLHVQGVDMLDGTPLLDIKPYFPEFDVHPADKTGWYDRRTRP